MADPRRRANVASDHSLSGEAHPFLTPRGLWLQQSGRVDLPEGVPLRSTAPGPPQHPSRQHRVDDPDQSAHLPSGRPTSPEPPLLGRFDDSPLSPGTLQNIYPAKRFGDLAALRRKPLEPLFRSALAADPFWQPVDASEVSTAAGQDRPSQNIARAVGKLIIRLPINHGSPYASGSAFLTGPNTLMTCAHNLFDSNTRNWSRALEFYPGYDFYSDQPQPFARVLSAAIPKAYLENPLSNHDLAICRLDTNIGEHIGVELTPQVVEHVEFFDSARVDILGYPAGSGFDFGKQLWRSRGRFLFGVSGGGEDDFAPTFATDFGGGASGGPWVTRDPDSNRPVVVGVTSGHAKLRHDHAEPNLMSLTSALFSQRNLDRLDGDFAEHHF
ncbi:trypsin-like serine peptidase [Rhodopirellula sallentina]|uniref:trypsin-like serine peptidase n=1 Tax=Rhodopirellula sallentina TaxID=1263869 RepID=UPI0003480D82|nr:trypsin-like peptidase domain-containing protein [Rhodopirellula sallentina]